MKTKISKIMLFAATVGAVHQVAAQPPKSAMVLGGKSETTPVPNKQSPSASSSSARSTKARPTKARRTLLSVAQIPVESMLYGEPETASIVLLERDMPHTQITRSWTPRATRLQPMPRISVHPVSHVTTQNSTVRLSFPGTVILSKKPLISKSTVAPVKIAGRDAGALSVSTQKRAKIEEGTARPTVLASRHNNGDQILLAQLEAQLRQSSHQLNQADAQLTKGQKQLLSFNNTLRQAMMEAGPDAKGLHPFVKVAQRYAGTPYVWGGESARGFDCSGFIIRVMRDLGYKALPHSAAEQFNYGKPIAQALLKPGDIVFFANTYKPGVSHVGIYLGRRRFIHAAGTGLGTIVSSLDSAKFQSKYAGARRLISARG